MRQINYIETTRQNNTFLNSGSVPNQTDSFTTYGRFTSAGGANGYHMEAIVWNQTLEPYRTDITNNVNTYYGIY